MIEDGLGVAPNFLIDIHTKLQLITLSIQTSIIIDLCRAVMEMPYEATAPVTGLRSTALQ